MAARNICKCPPPSQNTITCPENAAATCYTDEAGDSHGGCFPLSVLVEVAALDWDEMRQALGKMFGRKFAIAEQRFAQAEWTGQTIEGEAVVVSVHFSSRSGINLVLPPGVLDAAKFGAH